AFAGLDYVAGDTSNHDCPARIDFDADGVVDLCDVVDFLTFFFLDGPDPAYPFPECRVSRFEVLPCTLTPCPQ
ncbi:MAG: hypothetical protein KDC38_13605, partial [Planctomycetes bacterium]|nr:hypothetical protein [Planctomycetota bacterium]